MLYDGELDPFATNTRRLREIVNIVAYFIGVVLLGALIAPPLYWAGQAVAEAGILRSLAGVEFQKFFNRAILISAVILVWPTIRALQIRSWTELGLERDRCALRHALAGAAIASLCVAG